MTIKTTPIVGGTPSGGIDGDILVKDSSVAGGYRWGSLSSVSPPSQIVSGNTNWSIIDTSLAEFPWANAGEKAVRGVVRNTTFVKVAEIQDTNEVPGSSVDDVYVSFESNGAQKVHLNAATYNGRDLSADGGKLDGIASGAQVNYPQVTSAEKASAAGITGLRSMSPKDVTDIANALNIGNYPTVTVAEIQDAPNVTDNRSFSPSDVYGIFDYFNEGEANPARVNSSELSNPGAYSTIRSFSPNDTKTLITNVIVKRSSQEYNMPAGASVTTWNHGDGIPDIVKVVYICQIAEYGYNPGDIISAEYFGDHFTVFLETGKVSFLKNSYEPLHVRRDNMAGNFRLNPSNWRFKIQGIWFKY